MSRYRQPMRLNWVMIVVVLGLIAGGYAAVKFGPVYWTRYKVDEVLTDVAFGAIDLRTQGPDSRYDEEQGLVEKARGRILELGIDAEGLNVWFEPDMSAVHADYTVMVSHPVGGPTVLEFHRAINVPGDNKVP